MRLCLWEPIQALMEFKSKRIMLKLASSNCQWKLKERKRP